MRQIIVFQLSFAAASMGAFVGCNKAPFDIAPVRGTVTLDGQPLSAGKVMFAPVRTGSSVEAGKPAIGVIRENGAFELSTYGNGDGAVVGEHWVTVFGPDSPSATKPATRPTNEQAATTPKFDRISVTEKQSVQSGVENQITIALTSNDLAKYSVRAE